MIKAIVTDIEGTTTSLAFVKDVLFPYARQHMAQFIKENAHNEQIRAHLNAVSNEVGKKLNDEDLTQLLINWIDQDKKNTPLKSLQGMIWKSGYESGAYTGHVYADAAHNLKRWHEQGIKLFVFSSGSVQAQRLIFGYSSAGDLTSYFTDYFDTKIGNKRETTAYQTITKQTGVEPHEILFLSDIKQELDAAKEVGMRTIWLVRDGPVKENAEHSQVNDFNEILLS